MAVMISLEGIANPHQSDILRLIYAMDILMATGHVQGPVSGSVAAI